MDPTVIAAAIGVTGTVIVGVTGYWPASGTPDSAEYIATSTGTKTGAVRERPSTYSSGAGGFTVTIP